MKFDSLALLYQLLQKYFSKMFYIYFYGLNTFYQKIR